MRMNQESLAAGHGSCFAWQDRHGAYLHLIFTRKLDGAKKASFTFAYLIFSIILLHASHGLPTATARNTFYTTKILIRSFCFFQSAYCSWSLMLLRVLSFGYPLDEFHTTRHIYRDLEEEKFRFLIETSN